MATATSTSELKLGSVKIDEAGAACKRITIEIPADVVDDRLGDGLNLLTTQVRLPGFRPGKAPRRLVERRFAKGIEEETRAKLMEEAVEQVLTNEKMRTIGRPVAKDTENLRLVSGQPFTFACEVEVMPDFDLPKYEGLPLKRPVMEITRDLVDKEIKAQQERRGTVEPIDGDPQPGDYFFGSAELLDADGKVLGTVAETISRLPLESEDDRAPIAGIQVEGVGKFLKGKKAGDVVEVQTTGPENHELEPVRGQKITIRFTIANVGRLNPLTMEQLLQQTGFEIEGQLRTQLEVALAAQIRGEQQDVLRRQTTKALLEDVDMELPERASAAQTARIMESFRLRLLSQGTPAYLLEEKMAQIRDASAERARNELKLMFILERLCEEFKIELTEDEINSRIAQIAARQNLRPDKVREELAKSGRAQMLVMQMRHEKATDAIIERANITDVSAQEWNDEMDAQSAQAATAKDKTAKKSSSKKSTTKKSSSKKSSSKKKSKDD